MTQTTKRLDAADRTVLFYGLLAALLGLGLHFVAIHRYRPWDQPFTMVFLLQLAWLAPLAGALLSGMRSDARWLIALAAYVLVLPCCPPTDWAGTPKTCWPWSRTASVPC